MKKMSCAGMIVSVLFLTVSCSSEFTVPLTFSSKLVDGKKIDLAYEIAFDAEESCSKLEKESDKIKYALSMVFIKVNSQELSRNGERKTRNALLVILKRHFSEKVKDVYVTGLKVTAG